MTILMVRRLELEDLPTRVRWLNTPSVLAHMSIETPVSLSSTRQWFTQNTLSVHRRDFSFLSHSTESDDELVAMGGLTDIEQRHRRAELYVVVSPGMTGRGIGTRAVQWLCNYGFIELGLNRIYLHTFAANERAQRLYNRVGFSLEGILRSHAFHHGASVDRHVYGLLRDEWENMRWRANAPMIMQISLDE